MKQVLIRQGQIRLEEVPAPIVEPGYVLVETLYSLISTGTEMSSVNAARKSLVRRAIDEPEQLAKVFNFLKKQGLQKTVARVQTKLEAASPVGYSCSGKVLAVGAGVVGFQPGDLVACAGAGLASHAEVVLVPQNLVVKIPAGCGLKEASTVTLGAIALQGVRRAEPRLGEIVAVIGLGLLGQLTVQLLRASGCQVIGIDLDARRVELAGRLGAQLALAAGETDVEKEVLWFTDQRGVDATVITAASSSSAIVQQAMHITRKKGKVVLVGAVGMDLQRSPFYEKEIDFLISTSYGPGRYDETYEHRGRDYPYAYVRWTENRNMGEYLRLVAAGSIDLEPILEQEYDISAAPAAYTALSQEGQKPLAVVLRYTSAETPGAAAEKHSAAKVVRRSIGQGKVGIALVGAGNFAKSMHLPNLKRMPELFNLYAVVDSSGPNARVVAEQVGAAVAATDFEQVLADPQVDAVLLSTRHNIHAAQVLAALRAGKHVFCEKPLALQQDELNAILDFYGVAPENLFDLNPAEYSKGSGPLLTVDFNRRFSPAVQMIHQLTQTQQTPLLANYRMNAGYLPPESWTQAEEGGGRLVGEGCHIIDLFYALVGSPAVELAVQTITPHTAQVLASDNAIVTVKFQDGSLASLLYTAMGHADLAKEYLEVFHQGHSFIMDDYKKLTTYGLGGKGWANPVGDKGHFEALRRFGEAVRQDTDWPIPLWQLGQVSALAIQAQALVNQPTNLDVPVVALPTQQGLE